MKTPAKPDTPKTAARPASFMASVDAATGFAQLSTQVLEFRALHQAELSAEQLQKLEQSEAELDRQVVTLRARGIDLIGEQAAEALAELDSALAHARQQLDTMAATAHSVRLAGALVDLAAAVIGRDAKSVLAAARALRSEARTQSTQASAGAKPTPAA